MFVNPHRSGFTLLELMLTIVCAAFVVMGISFVIIAPFRESLSAPVKSSTCALADEAVFLAAKEIRASKIADLTIFSGADGGIGGTNADGTFAIYILNGNLIYNKNGSLTTLLDSGVTRFDVAFDASLGLYQIDLTLGSDNGSASYQTNVRCRR